MNAFERSEMTIHHAAGGASPRRLPTLLLAAAIAVAGTACDSDAFEVENPGAILDQDLNTPRAVSALVVGMSSEFSEGYDGQSFLIARATDEMAGSGSYFLTGLVRRGLIDRESVNGFWNDAQEARWLAEAGIERMREIENFSFTGHPLTARAHLLAGLSNRWLGENFCEVTFDEGDLRPREDAFSRATGYLEGAIQHGQSAGADDIVQAANGALAQVHVGLGDWAAVEQYAAQVDTDFEYVAFYSTNSGVERNEIWLETHGRGEMSVFGTYMASLDPQDPRTPWTDCTEVECSAGSQGADGETPHYRQEKYPELGSDIPLVKGTEMRLLEAEAALRDSDLTTAMNKINEVRMHYGLSSVTATGIGEGITGDPDSMTGWDILDRERLLTLWMEGRRLWDLHRWDHPFLYGGEVVYEPTVERRFSCLPVADSECQSNPNIECSD